jgi:hypothetical protein
MAMAATAPPQWDGTRLSDGHVALVVFAAGGPSPGSTPAPVVAAASNGQDARVVAPAQLDHFMRVHSASQLVCDDAGQLYRTVNHHLTAAGDRAVQQGLGQVVAEGRLDDVGLLDQLIRLAGNGPGRLPRQSLPQLAPQFGGISLRDDEMLRALVADATRGATADARAALEVEAGLHAQALARVFEALRPRLNALGISPLSLALQVKGAVALAGTQDGGLHLATGAVRRVADACTAARDHAASVLLASSDATRWLKRGKGRRPQWGLDGAPPIRLDEMRVWLDQQSDGVRDLHQHEFFPPRTGDGRVSADSADWAELVRSDRLLAAWYDLTAAVELAPAFADAVAAGGPVRPVYAVLPRLHSQGPDLDLLRRLGVRAIFIPAPGQVFLALRLLDLPLRSLAAMCRARGNGSKLADLFARGADPYAHAAAALNGPTVACLAALLSATCRGLSVDRVWEIVCENSGLANLGRAEVAGWYGRLTREVFPELGLFLQDDTLDVMAANLGTTAADLGCHLDTYWSPRPPLPQLRKWLRAYRKQTGRTKENLTALLEHCALSGPVPELLRAAWFADDALFHALFSRRMATLTGRVRGGLSFSQARSVAYLDLADDAVKSALFAVAAAGYRVAAFAEDTILVALPDRDGLADEAVTVAEVARHGAEQILGGVPAACRGELLPTW